MRQPGSRRRQHEQHLLLSGGASLDNTVNNSMKHCLVPILIFAIAASSQAASEHHGQVKTGELPIPGAVVRAVQGDKVLRAVTDSEGNYSVTGMSDGTWTIQIEMLGFAPMQQE